MLDDDKKAELIRLITEKISSKGKSPHCPMCGNNSFSLVDGYFSNGIQQDFSSVSLGGPAVPSATIICTNCGFMSQHALGAIGIKVEQ